MKIHIAAIAAAAVLAVLLTGCGEDATPRSQPQSFAQTVQETPAVVETEAPPSASPPAHITEPGEVCDPGNLNDSICAAFYPDQAFANMTDRGSVALSDLPADEKQNLARQACSTYASGGSADTEALMSGDDNRTLFTAAAVAYCPEYAPSSKKWPDRTRRLISYYQGLGEAASKAEFEDGSMPAPEALGY